eukprot:Hpha_TRINITY_DN30541_c0_g1::TRINITY_DN30541_c0_g1_i1::g.193704::m.193704
MGGEALVESHGMPEDVADVFAPDESLQAYLAACAEESDEDTPEEVEPPPPPARRERRRQGDRHQISGTPLKDLWGGIPLPDNASPAWLPTRPVSSTDPCVLLRGAGGLTGRVVLDEKELCKQLLCWTKGLPVEVVVPSTGKLSGWVLVEGYTRGTLESLCEPLLKVGRDRSECAATLARLSSRATAEESVPRRRGGTMALVPALLAGIGAVLQACDQLLGRAGELSLLRAEQALLQSGLAEAVRACSLVCTEAARYADDTCGVRMLLDRVLQLASRRLDRTADLHHRRTDVVTALGMRLLEAWLSELGSWLRTGRLSALAPSLRGSSAPSAQSGMLFLVERGPTVGDVINLDSRWHVEKDQVPAFLGGELADAILRCGKSAWFLSRARGAQQRKLSGAGAGDGGCSAVPALDLPADFFAAMEAATQEARSEEFAEEEDGLSVAPFDLSEAQASGVRGAVAEAFSPARGRVGELPLMSQIRGVLAQCLANHERRVTAELAATLEDHYELRSRLRAVRQFVLLQGGRTMRHWCDSSLFPCADRKDAWDRRPPAQQLWEGFERSLAATGVQGTELRLALEGLQLSWEDPTRAAAVASFTGSADDEHPERTDIPQPLRVAGGVSLCLKCDPMLSAIFPEEALRAQTRAFQVLAMVSFSKSLLVSVKLPKVRWQMSALERLVSRARLQLLRFVSPLYEYLLHAGAAAWGRVEESVESARDLDGCRSEQLQGGGKLLDALCHSRRQAVLWHTLQDILSLVVSFAERARPFVDWLHQTASFATRARSRRRPALPIEYDRDLRQFLGGRLTASLNRYMAVFIDMAGSSDRSDSLLAAFDFNYFYRSSGIEK